MCALGLDLNVGAPRVFTSGGVPSPDGVIITEGGAFIITESGVDMLAFEPTGNVTRSYANSDNTLLLTVTGSSAAFTWSAVSGAIDYKLVIGIVGGTTINPLFTPPLQSGTLDLNAYFTSGDVLYAYLGTQTSIGGSYSGGPPISGITF